MMAKLTMKRVRLVALRRERKALLETLQRLGAVQIEAMEDRYDGFAAEDMEAKAQTFDRSAAVLTQALEVLQDVFPEKKGLLASFAGRREVEPAAFEQAAARSAAVLQDGQQVLALQRQQAENAAEQVRVRTALAQLEPWEIGSAAWRGRVWVKV